MKKLLHRINENRIVDFLFILFISLILMFQFFNPTNDIFSIEGKEHVSKAYWTLQSMKENGSGKIISNYINNFGYAGSLSGGSLSTYIIIVFGMIFKSFKFAFKLSTLLIMIFSGITMYIFIYQFTEKRSTAVLSSIIYITSPYFFTDMYVRHAINESIIFVFLPLIFLGLYNLFNTEKNHYYLILGLSGLILSNNQFFCVTIIFVIIYIIINIKNLSATRVKKGIFIDTVFVLLITSFYWLPLIQAKFYCKYGINSIDKNELLDKLLTLKTLFITPRNTRFVFEIGFPVIAMMAFSFVGYMNIKENKKEYLFFIISGVICVWMSTKYFPWKIVPDNLVILKYSWQMLMYSTFFFAVIASLNMSNIIKNFKAKDVIIISVICVIYIFSRYYVIEYNEIKNINEYEIEKVSGQNDEELIGMGKLENLPRSALENTFYIATREDKITVIDGDCNIFEENKQGSHLIAKLEILESTKLELPYIYYPGYLVRFDGMIMPIRESENGFIEIDFERQDVGSLEINYTQTNLMKISKIISIITFIVYLVYVWKKH